MPNLFDVLSGLERGVSEADENLGRYHKAASQRESFELDALLKRAKLQELQDQYMAQASTQENLKEHIDAFYQLYSEGDAGITGKVKEKLGDFGIAPSKTHEKRKEAHILREEIIGQIISQKGLPKNKQTYEALRKEITPTTKDQIPSLKRGLLTLLGLPQTEEKPSLSHRENHESMETVGEVPVEEEGEPPVGLEENPAEKEPSLLGRLKKWGGNLKEEFSQNPDQVTRDIVLTAPKVPARLAKGAANIGLSLAGKMAGDRSALPEKLRGKLNEFSDRLGKKYDQTMGINPKSSAADLGDVLGSFLAPAVKAKPLLAGATNALGYGALSKAAEGADLEDIVKGAPKDIGMGLALSALPAGIARQANKKTDLLLKGATRSPKEALRLQKRVGEKGGKLSLGHALNEQGAQERFERARLPFAGTKNSLRKTKAAISEISRDLEKKFPNQPRALGNAIQKNLKKARQRASNLYEEAAGIEGVKDLVLSPEQLERVVRGSTSLKNGPSVTQTPEVYRLTLKEGDKVNRKIQEGFSSAKRELQRYWNGGKPSAEYFRLYRNLGLPNYLDVQDYYQALNRFASKEGVFQPHVDPKLKAKWYQRIDPIKEVIQDMDKTGKFKRANTFYKRDVLPYKKEKGVWKSAEVLQESEAVSPVFDFFSKEGNVNAEKIFNQLSKEDKRRVIGMMLHKNRAIDTPLIRSTYREEKNLPSYITHSKDPYVKKLVEEIEDAARLNTNLTQIQGSLKTKGSGQETNRLANSFLASLIGTGGVQTAKTVGTLGTGGIYQNLRRRYDTSPKTLEKYLSPETLKEIRRIQAARVSEFLIKNQRKKGDEK